MAQNNSSTPAQRSFIISLAKDLTDEQLSAAIRKTGSSSDRAHMTTLNRNQRLQHLTKTYASKLIDLLKDKEFVSSLIVTEEHEEKKENPLEAFTDRFHEGVNHEEAQDVLREYLNAGAKAKLAWELEGNTYIVKILVSMVEDVDYFEPLGFVFGNQDLDDTSAFDDGKNGDRADESDPFERCENELLKRFGITRDNLEEISVCW